MKRIIYSLTGPLFVSLADYLASSGGRHPDEIDLDDDRNTDAAGETEDEK